MGFRMSGGVTALSVARSGVMRAAIVGGLFVALFASMNGKASAAVVRLDHHEVGVFFSPGSKAAKARARNAAPTGLDGPIPGGDPPVLYGGGPVVPAMNTRAIYWTPAGYSFPSGYVSGFDTFLSDLAAASGAGGNVTAVSHQYVDPGGSALGSITNTPSAVDASAYPSSGCPLYLSYTICLTDSQIISELSSFITSNQLPTGLNYSYIVQTPPNVGVCFDSTGAQCEGPYFCGYHNAFSVGGTQITYTVLPYTGGDCDTSGGGPHAADLDSAVTIEAHEMVETATDPVPSSGYVDPNKEEVADECAWLWGSTNPSSTGGQYNQTINGDQYLLQEMWSDQDATCDQQLPTSYAASITGGGVTIKTGGTASYTAQLDNDLSAPASYAWHYAYNGGPPQTAAAFGPSAQITFPSAGSYVVWATITDSAGGTVTGATQSTVDNPPKAGFTWATSGKLTAQDSVLFDSSSVAGAGAITRSSWAFGDGGSATGSITSHTYAKAGTYGVTLTVTQTDGFTATFSTNLAVAAKKVVPPKKKHPRRIVHSRLRHSARHRYQLRVWGSGYPARHRLTIIVRIHNHRSRLRVRANAAGKFTKTVSSRFAVHLVGTSPAAQG